MFKEKLNKLCLLKSGSVRVRELNDEEKLKAQERRRQLVASLEAKKRQLRQTEVTSDEPGEFRVLVDDESDDLEMIAETIGICYIYLGKDFGNDQENGISLLTLNEGSSERKFKGMRVVKEQKGSFAIENILRTNGEDVCEQSPLKDWIKSCDFARLRTPTEEEKSRLQELKGEALGLQSLKLKLRPSNLQNLLMKLT